MPDYTLDEAEKLVPDEIQQVMMFGSTIRKMRGLNRDGKISTWCELEGIFTNG